MIHLLAGGAWAMGIDHVPADFPTLQDAIDHGRADTIRLSPGRYEGAIVSRRVRIVGEGAVIDRGVELQGARAGLVLPADADGTRIVGVVFDCSGPRLDLGVYGSAEKVGSVGDDIEIAGSTFVQCTQAVTNTGLVSDRCDTDEVSGGAFWAIRDNVIVGLATRFDGGRPGGGVGIFLYNVRGADVWANAFVGPVQDVGDMATTAIGMAGCIDCTVAENVFDMRNGRFWYTALNNLGADLSGAVATRDLLVVDNDAGGDSAPWLGVSFVSRDSVATEADGNLGAVYVDHERCGDGALYSMD